MTNGLPSLSRPSAAYRFPDGCQGSPRDRRAQRNVRSGRSPAGAIGIRFWKRWSVASRIPKIRCVASSASGMGRTSFDRQQAPFVQRVDEASEVVLEDLGAHVVGVLELGERFAP